MIQRRQPRARESRSWTAGGSARVHQPARHFGEDGGVECGAARALPARLGLPAEWRVPGVGLGAVQRTGRVIRAAADRLSAAERFQNALVVHMLSSHWERNQMLLVVVVAALAVSSPAWDTSTWVGAEYTPWRASNELWWAQYPEYRADVQRELGLIKETLGFNTLRVWLHSMLYEADAAGLKTHLDDFLSLCDAAGFRVGLVFFDDCWNHAGANLSQPCVPRRGCTTAAGWHRHRTRSARPSRALRPT